METVLAGLAVLVSLAASYFALKAHRDSLTHGTVADVYEEFNTLAQLRLDHWELSHIQEVPENYESVVEAIKAATADLSEQRKLELLVKERAVAIMVFSLFEQACYQREQAKRNSDKARQEFMSEVIAYFTDRMLQNPRLKYFWDQRGGNLRAYYEPLTQQILELRSTGIEEDEMDYSGPFGGDHRVQVADRDG